MAQDPLESSRPPLDTPGAPKFDHGLRRQAVVESLLLDIVQRKLEPGSHLVTQTLADRFGMSHTPIREALIALAGIGVVDILPNKGTVVRKVGPREVREICNVRRTLECEAVRGACGRMPPPGPRWLPGRFRPDRRRPAAVRPGPDPQGQGAG